MDEDQIQTRVRGTQEDEYDIYLNCEDDGDGYSRITGERLLTFDEWLNT